MDTSPHSREAETAILGAVLLDNSCWWQTENLSAEDFYLHSHRVIFARMVELAEDQKPIDFVTLCECLMQHKEVEAVGGVAYVTSLTDGLPRVKNIGQYVEIVNTKARERKFLKTLQSAIAKVSEYDYESIGQLIRDTDRELLGIETRQKNEPKKLCDILPEADRQMEEDRKINIDRKAVGFRTGLDPLDEMTTGYRAKEVTVIGGESSDGKSSLMRQGIIANACDGARQLVFSREVKRERIALDIKGFVSGINPRHIRDGRLMVDLFERQRFQDINKQLAEWPLWIDDSRELHVRDLVHKARKLIRTERIQVIWVDYIQLISGDGDNKTERTENVCAGIWNLADSENVAVIALSQLNREKEKGKKMRPRMGRSKDAGKIEQDAHCLIFVYQPEDSEGNRQSSMAEVIVAKQRHGPTGTIKAEFSKDELIFKERA